MSTTKERSAQDVAKRAGLAEGPRDLSDIGARLSALPAGADAKKKDAEIKALAAAQEPAPGAFDAPKAVGLDLDTIAFSEDNPRKEFDQAKLAELAESIKRQGLLQPILVRSLNGRAKGKLAYEVVAGARRVKAAQLAGLKSIPAIVRELNDVQAIEIMLTENGQREDVTPIEEARGFQVAIAKAKYSPQALAVRTGKSLRYVYARLELLKLPPKIAKAYEAGEIETEVASMLARLPEKWHARALDNVASEQVWTDDRKRVRIPVPSRYVRGWIDSVVYKKILAAPFDPADAQLVKDPNNAKAWALPCATCPKNTDNNPRLEGKPGCCTDPVCWQAKVDAHLAAAKKAGAVAITEDHWSNEKNVKTKEEYVRVSKPTKDTREAVVVNGDNKGQVVHVRLKGAAKPGEKSKLSPEDRRQRTLAKARGAKRRGEELHRRQVFDQAVGKAKWPLSRKALELVAGQLCGRYFGDKRTAVLIQAIGCDRSDLENGRVQKFSNDTLAKALLALALEPHLQVSEYAPSGGIAEMDAAARLAGLDPQKNRKATAQLPRKTVAVAKALNDPKRTNKPEISPEAKKAGWKRDKNGTWTIGKPAKKTGKKAAKKPAKKAAKKKR